MLILLHLQMTKTAFVNATVPDAQPSCLF